MQRYFAWFISIICHPLLIVTYMLLLLLLIDPYAFGYNSIEDKNSKILILTMFMSTFFIPLMAVVMMRALGLISSIAMAEKEDRILPYIVTGIFYLAMFRYLLYFQEIPSLYKSAVLGSIIGLFLAFFINIFSKISMHAVGIGGLIGMILITMLIVSYDTFTFESSIFGVWEISLNVIFMFCIVLAGSVATSRLILKAHSFRDLYGGFIVGFCTQFIALRFFL